MAHENEIPEYALQPAKAPAIIAAEAIYHTETIRYPAQTCTVTYEFEEDILVPDRNPDLREILLMDASCDVNPGEKKLTPKTDDLLSMTGTVSIQTIYAAEGVNTEPTVITSKVPYQYQWKLEPKEEADGVFSCKIQKLESMVINERKFRVKITLAFAVQMLCSQEFPFFAGIKDEDLEMKQARTQLCCLELVKKDELSIDETFGPRDSRKPETVLKQDFVVTENYRQVTTEKVVVNGFVYCNLLYRTAGGEDSADGAGEICQMSQRIEFTQFIPIEKEQRGKNWSFVRIHFTGQNLDVTVTQNEEEPENVQFQLRGSVQSRIELYSRRDQEMVIDAYHREKAFDCDFSRRHITGFTGEGTAETSVREIIGLPEGSKMAAAVYASARVEQWTYRCERGRVLVNGSLSGCALWKDQDGGYHAEKVTSEFHGSVDVEAASPQQQAVCRPMIKEAWLEYINEKQVELNVSMVLWVETCQDETVTLLEKPRFVERAQEKTYPMVIVTMQPGSSLWDLAKRYRTTESHLRIANQLEEEPRPGQKLLIIK